MFKVIYISLLVVIALSGYAYAGEVGPPMALDQTILELPITLTSGETVTLQQFKGNKPVYLKFWASYCRDCLKQMPNLQRTYQKYGDKVQIIAINLGVNDDTKSVAAVQGKFGLQMPIAIDKSGKLAKAFNLIATPYHVLLDKGSSIVYAKYTEPIDLDKTIKLVSEGHTLSVLNASQSSAVSAINLNSLAEKPTALFFLATWCDWYLKDSRPTLSKSCIASQKQVNKLAAQYPQINWLGVVTRLWTEDKDVAEYQKKFNVQHPLTIDDTNAVFLAYDVKDIPTLILLDNGKEVFRTRQINASKISTQLQQLSSGK
jgi:thiol-disulfide isomerase/thioredoxin